MDIVERKSLRSQLGDRYKTYLMEAHGFEQVDLTYPGVQRIQGFPMLGATPDAKVNVQREGATPRYVVIFRECRSLGLRRLNDAITRGEASVPIRQRRTTDGNNEYYLLDNERRDASDIWYEVEGLLRAYPDADACHFVAFGKTEQDVIHVHINRPERYNKVTDEILGILRDFYYKAILPELAHPRKEQGFDLRTECLSEEIVNQLHQRILPANNQAHLPEA